MGLFDRINRERDEQLEAEGQRARINYECARSINIVDSFIQELKVMDHFFQRDKTEAAQFTERLTSNPLIDLQMQPGPFLVDTRECVYGFLKRVYPSFSPDDIKSMRQALFNIAAEGYIPIVNDINNFRLQSV